jgi:hypothetical protein
MGSFVVDIVYSKFLAQRSALRINHFFFSWYQHNVPQAVIGMHEKTRVKHEAVDTELKFVYLIKGEARVQRAWELASFFPSVQRVCISDKTSV